MGRAIMYEYSFRNQLGILSGQDALLGLSFCTTFCTRSSVTFKNSGESSNGRRSREVDIRYSSSGNRKAAFMEFTCSCKVWFEKSSMSI